MTRPSRRPKVYYVIVDPAKGEAWAGRWGNFSSRLDFVPYGNSSAAQFDNERDAWLAVRDMITANLDNPEFPSVLEVRKMVRSDSMLAAKRVGLNDPGVKLLHKVQERFGRAEPIAMSVRWLVTRSDWERWGFALRIIDEDIDEEELTAACEQLSVDAVFVEPYIFTDTFKSAVALKLAFEGSTEIVDINA